MQSTVARTKTESSEMILPGDLNSMGFLFGGRLVSLIDKVGAISAIRHVKGAVVTVSIDNLIFKKPVTNGSVLTIRGSVNRVFSHSMEVGVVATTLPPGQSEEQHVCTAYLTYVAIDEKGKPREVAPVIPETADEKRRFEHALIRRNHRLSLAEQLAKSDGATGSKAKPKPSAARPKPASDAVRTRKKN
jgi:acyl-CoA hydrolase